MGHLTSAETNGNLHLIALFQELLRILALDLEIVIADVGRQPDFFDFHGLLFLTGFFFFLFLIKLVLGEIHQFAYRRLGAGSNHYQIQILFDGHVHGILSRNNTYLRAILVNESDFSFTNLFVDQYFANGLTPPGIFYIENKKRILSDPPHTNTL